LTKQPNTKVQRIPARSLKRIQLSKGIFSRVARKLGVSVPAVTLVAHGKRSSKRITRALETELSRIEKIVDEIDSESAA
jgi:predicted transcriptional regulator